MRLKDEADGQSIVVSFHLLVGWTTHDDKRRIKKITGRDEMKWNRCAWIRKKMAEPKIIPNKIYFCRLASIDLIWFDLTWFDLIPFNTIQYNTIPFNSIPFHSIPFHSIPFNSIQFNSIPSGALSHEFIDAIAFPWTTARHNPDWYTTWIRLKVQPTHDNISVTHGGSHPHKGGDVGSHRNGTGGTSANRGGSRLVHNLREGRGGFLAIVGHDWGAAAWNFRETMVWGFWLL
jgi:hypothetical protein